MSRVHVVVSDPQHDRILPRMARALAEHNGWTLGERADPKADLNYYLPYLELSRRRGTTKTKTAAYFSHYEPESAKARTWDEAAKAVDLRIVTAAQYRDQLAPFGATVQVPPPVDLTHFKPGSPRAAGTPPVVGVSGWVYPGGRKGEALVKAAAASDLGQTLTWKGAGKGWPVPTRLYSWDKLPAFYRSLDAYLCAATIEGVPMPPLEAMACGVPVVIPRGVGLLDELPECYDVFRYDAGSLDSLLAALEDATSGRHAVDRKTLRAAVAGFTVDAWCEANARAVTALLDAAPPAVSLHHTPQVPQPLPATQGKWVPLAQDVDGVGVYQRTDRGIYVVAYGEPARLCARRLLGSLREHMPEIPVMLVGDQPLDAGETHFVEAPRGDIGARSVKVQIYDLAPAAWQHVLYLDADTELVAPVPFLFDVLDGGWDLTICKNPARFHVAQHMVRPDNGEECRETFKLWGTDQIMQWNGGVFAFTRNERTRAFFQAWHREWLRYGKRDQAALLRALWAHPLRLYPLGNEWNLVPTYDPVSRSAGIVHHVTEAREWGKGIIPQRGDSPEAFAAVARSRRAGGIVDSRAAGRFPQPPRTQQGGPLVKVEIRPGQYIRVSEKEAERLRSVLAEKARQQVANKMCQPAENKG